MGNEISDVLKGKINPTITELTTRMQTKYGVVMPPDIQEKYGVVMPPDIQEKYGVVMPPDIQEKYGVIDPGPDFNITYNQLEENIATLKKAISTLKDSWNGQTKANINKINSSWVGPDCALYTEKLTSMDDKVQRTIQSLELLCSTYENARDMVKDRQRDVINQINNS